MAKYLVETYYTCTFKVNHYLDEINELELKNIEIIGLMGMATYTEDLSIINYEFKKLNELKVRLSKTLEDHNHDFKELSMGMSGDYKIALANGSTMIRIGSAIFGTRNHA